LSLSVSTREGGFIKTLLLAADVHVRELSSAIRSRWKIILTVALVGVVLGWTSAAARAPWAYAANPAFKTRIITFPRTYTVAVVPMPAALSAKQEQTRELRRLKTRNRRLESLVRVLRAGTAGGAIHSR
jgi:hypothetical protein